MFTGTKNFGLILIILLFSVSAYCQPSDPPVNTNNTDNTNSAIIQSIDNLEKRVTQLEKLVTDLQAKISNNSNTNRPSPKTDNKEVTVTVNKPTDQEIRTAITASLQKKIPVKWINHLGITSNTTVRSVTVNQWGVYNERYQYWPVNLRVVGSCEISNIFNKEQRSFDGSADFRLMKNVYGQWVAIHSEL